MTGKAPIAFSEPTIDVLRSLEWPSRQPAVLQVAVFVVSGHHEILLVYRSSRPYFETHSRKRGGAFVPTSCPDSSLARRIYAISAMPQ